MELGRCEVRGDAVERGVSRVTRRGRLGRAHRAMQSLLVALILDAAVTGCSWFTDFKQQPKIDPWESAGDSIPPRGNPQSSVPVFGSAAPGFAYDRSSAIPVIETMSGIANPVAADTRSLNNGRMLFQINCAVCHGALGRGDGPATRFGMAGIGLTTDITKNRTDGYIFAMIRNGRNLMPSYNRIEEPDRWDVVNYVRALQGRYGATPDTAHGRPGETGALVPGASATAPTRPAPYYNHIYPQAGAMPRAAGQTPATTPPAAPGAVADSARPSSSTDTASRRRQP